MRVMCFIL